ncbi:PREDICTED: putative esterase C31F10.02 [Nelumbo nucifera]|uniref:Acyl-coenzyme A thioesterase 13-like n=2 Tax=Nelumbo nucifera TaxID=4432 RepID=A0A822Z3Y5_NELNU|nr:PREDICTED: putative esterase C31F10.02 [Nelumbo nucifera]DAD39243.1 TPA_asm: hypothetical protein HUJ06_013566 [Nelumbo nucifera]
MGLESVKRWLERGDGDSENTPIPLPPRLIDSLVAQGIKFDLVEPGRVVCSMKVPPRLVNSRNLLHGGATASLIDFVGAAVIFSAGAVNNGVSLEINVSYLDNALANVSTFSVSLFPLKLFYLNLGFILFLVFVMVIEFGEQ